jgi:putative tributyrin esterase
MAYIWNSHLLQSKALDGRRVYRLTLPDQPIGRGSRLGLLILLHGVHGAETDWIDQGGLVESLDRLTTEGKIGPLAVLTPSDGLAGIGSGYFNWAMGKDHRYEDYVIEDLLTEVEEKWQVGGGREKRSIAGLSMGGFAAIRLSLKNSHLFGSASSLSGFFNASEFERLVGTKTYQQMFKGSVRRVQQHSPIYSNIPSGSVPKLMFDCGISDAFIGQNRELHRRFIDLGISHDYVEHEGGHTWAYWQAHLADHLIFHEKYMKKS